MSGTIGTFTKFHGRRRQQADGQVNCAATTTLIVPARSTRSAVVITNLDAVNAVFIGETPATVADYELEAGKSITLESPAQIDGITAGGTVEVTFAESYLAAS